MENRPMYVKRLILAFVLATIIFISGFLVSNLVCSLKYNSVISEQEILRYELLSLDIEEKLMLDSCELFDPYALSARMDNLGKTLSSLEMKYGLFDERVVEQKKLYSLLEAQHLLSVMNYNENCGDSIDILLFFYSNQEGNLEKAENVGYILGFYKKENKNSMIYSFDYDLDSPIVKILKNKYGVDNPNMVIINEDTKILDLKNVNELRSLL